MVYPDYASCGLVGVLDLREPWNLKRAGHRPALIQPGLCMMPASEVSGEQGFGGM